MGSFSAVVCVVLAVLALASCSKGDRPTLPGGWTEGERRTLRSLALSSLRPLPPDPSNGVGDDPRAAAFGHRLFFDTRLSANGEIACATCHRPDKLFTDGKPRSEAIGTTRRNAPTIVGTAYNPWFYWDGRRDSQWSQALSPLEDPKEHGGTRTQYVHVVARHYADAYAESFEPLPALVSTLPPRAGPKGSDAEREAWAALPRDARDAVDRIFANLGKAIAAYERLLLPGPSRFDAYVDALARGDESAMRAALSEDEVAGLRLFVGRANCTQCHNGPLFTNGGFHNIGLPLPEDETFDQGRTAGIEELLVDPFGCMSEFSDCPPGDCPELRFVKTEGVELVGAHKVPSLRGVSRTAPYMHSGQLPTLRDVLAHYDLAPLPLSGHSDLEPLQLTDEETGQLEAFLRALDGPVAVEPRWLDPPASGS